MTGIPRLALFLFALPSYAAGDSVRLADYDAVSHLFQAHIHFDDFSASSLPGVSIGDRRGFPGLQIGHVFDGQIVFVAQSGAVGAQGRTLNLPHTPVEIGRDQRVHDDLRAVRTTPQNHVLASKVFAPANNATIAQNTAREIREVGQGAISLRFKDPQRAVAFDMVNLKTTDGKLTLVVKFFLTEIHQGGDETVSLQSITIVEEGRYAFETVSRRDHISGVQVENHGATGFGIDNIEYQRPLLLGFESLTTSRKGV